MAYAGVEDHLQALQELDDAILAAADLEDEDALADLLDLRGSLNVSVQRFHEAQEDYGDAAAMRQSQRLEGHLDERDADEARVLQQHASTLYLLAQPQEAAAALSRARELLRHAPNDVGLAIVIEYTQAHLDRIFGGPDDALLPALHAASYFAAQCPNHANTAARTHLFSAEVALDMVARLDAARDRAAFLQMARAHLQEARRLAEQAQQQSADGSVGLVRLGEQRLARLTNGPAAHAAARPTPPWPTTSPRRNI
jgi:hypothetical protein